MAPKKPKKPTMLQRQRALRKMTQERKARSSKQLPSKGNTSANSRQARSQRTTTAKAQAANQQRVIARGMEGFVRRGKAMDKLDKAAKGTKGSGTRTAGAGGGLTRVSKPISRARRLPPSSQGGRRVGNSSQPFGEQPVRKVKVRDLGSTKALKGGKTTPKQLPPAQQGPQAATRRQRAQAKADAAAKGTRGPNRVGQPAGAANRKYGANVVNNAVKRAQQASRLQKGMRRVGRGSLAVGVLSAINAADDARLTPSQLKEKRKVVDPNWAQRKMSELFGRKKQKPSSKPQQQGPQQTPQMVADYKAKRDARHKALRDKMPTAKPRPSGSDTSPARTTRPAGKVPASSQTPPKPRFKGSVDEGRRIWAEKYSSSKYEGQAIQKEAKALLEKMKKRKEEKSAAQRAGWDGNKNY